MSDLQFNPFPLFVKFPSCLFYERSTKKSIQAAIDSYALILTMVSSARIVNIILADDDEDDRTMFEEVISEVNPGAKIHSVEDGSKLMKALADTADTLPDLIFLDLNMPIKNGKDCLEEIRMNERLKNIPVIIYSTSANLKDIDDTYNKGANLYICKPTSFRQLTAIARKIFTLNWFDYSPKSSKIKFVLSSY